MNNKTFSESKIEGSGIQGITEGSWCQNDTIWRCIIDINNLLLFADKSGIIKEEVQRKYLSIGDGIISGEGEGPMENTPKNTGVIISGYHPLAIDKVAVDLMGFVPEKINLLSQGEEFLFKKVGEIEVIKNEKDIQFSFQVPRNWECIKRFNA